MHRLLDASGLRRLAAVAGACLALAPVTAGAQRGEPQTARIYHGREHDTGDGYSSATVDVRYQFADCVGDVAVLYAMDRASIRVSGTYHYRGTTYNVPADIAPPRPSTVVFQGPILNNVSQFVGSFSDPYTQGGAGAGCVGQSKVVFSRKEKLGEGSTPAQYLAFLQTLWIRPQAQPRLRSSEVEGWIARQLATRRDDSLKVVAERERRDRASRARADSLERERQRAADRDRRAADSASAADRRRADDAATAEQERDREREGEREREQAAADAARARETQAMVDAQAERIQSMYRTDKLKFERAQAAEANGDLATARAIYEDLAVNSLGYAKAAQARLDAMDQQVVADGVVAAFQLMGQAWNGLKSLNQSLTGSGMTMGASYAQYGLPGNVATAGFTFTYVGDPMQKWVPYVDLGAFGMGGVADEEHRRFYPNKVSGDFALGSTVPRLKLALGRRASLSPHFGFRHAVTDHEDLSLGQTGLTLIVPRMMVRGDVIVIDGKPQFGLAMGRIF